MNAQRWYAPVVLRVIVRADDAPANVAEETTHDWQRLVERWKELGYGEEPPRCMAEYVDELIEAMK